jgi:hypothetical protein
MPRVRFFLATLAWGGTKIAQPQCNFRCALFFFFFLTCFFSDKNMPISFFVEELILRVGFLHRNQRHFWCTLSSHLPNSVEQDSWSVEMLVSWFPQQMIWVEHWVNMNGYWDERYNLIIHIEDKSFFRDLNERSWFFHDFFDFSCFETMELPKGVCTKCTCTSHRNGKVLLKRIFTVNVL